MSCLASICHIPDITTILQTISPNFKLNIMAYNFLFFPNKSYYSLGSQKEVGSKTKTYTICATKQNVIVLEGKKGRWSGVGNF